MHIFLAVIASTRAFTPQRTGLPLVRSARETVRPAGQTVAAPTDAGYDLVVVGSGNGACGLLNQWQATAPADARALVLEEGRNFFFTSDVTTQDNALRAWSQNKIFQLHDARTPKRRPIISGRARTHGGGGSINYTMMHESPKWLAAHLGKTEAYWEDLQKSLNAEFAARGVARTPTSAVATKIIESAVEQGYSAPTFEGVIPAYRDEPGKQTYAFPTQFDDFGLRTKSGVSLVDWTDPRITLETRARVDSLEFDGDRCVGVGATSLGDDGFGRFPAGGQFALKPGGRVALCSGAATPRFLMDFVEPPAAGQGVNDHILLPLGIYVAGEKLYVTPKDNYVQVFATSEVDGTLVTVDFFSGPLDKLLYLTSHLYLAFLPNFVKSIMLNRPRVFWLAKNLVRGLIRIVDVGINVVTRGNPPELVAAIVKYNAHQEGRYESGRRITLDWFEDPRDALVAKAAIPPLLPLLEGVANKPPRVVRWLIRLVTGAPYEARQVDKYVDKYQRNWLLSEQHLAGGSQGSVDREAGNLVRGTSNVHVADLSAVPLPRVSPQMTAYLTGYHVGRTLYS